MSSPKASHDPALIQVLNDAFRLAAEAMKLLIDNFNKGVHNLNTNPLIYLAPDFFSGLDGALNELRDYIDKFARVMLEFLEHQAPIIALIQSSFDWLDTMQKPVSDIVARVGKYGSGNLAYWSGPAATHYSAQVLARQQKALDQLLPKAEAISKWLTQVALTNIKFLTTYARKIGDIASNAVSALISAGTIIGALEAIGDAAELCGNLVKSAVTTFADSVEFYGNTVSSIRDAFSTLTNDMAFPKGAWPQSES